MDKPAAYLKIVLSLILGFACLSCESGREDLSNISSLPPKQRLRVAECGVERNVEIENSACGERYHKLRSAACGVEAYKQRRDYS